MHPVRFRPVIVSAPPSCRGPFRARNRPQTGIGEGTVRRVLDPPVAPEKRAKTPLAGILKRSRYSASHPTKRVHANNREFIPSTGVLWSVPGHFSGNAVFTRRTPPVRDIATARRLTVAGSYSGDVEPFLALRRLSPPSRRISEFSTSRSTIAVAMVVLKRMLPHSEKAVLVVMSVERFWLWRVEMT